ncbi:MAG TPA: hypothetical protein VEY71_01380 [Chitinophagales bacterium]|nr:hypothetical protein [Chitinophagales bacterium]
MRKLLALAALLLAVLFAFEGCKKGPEDPFMSFKSRKKRVEGYWRVTQLLYNNIDSLTHTTVWDTIPTTPVPLPPCAAWTTTFIHTYHIKFRFDADGRYEKDSVYTRRYQKDFSNNGTGPTACLDIDTLNLDFENKTITKGIWMFAGATGDIKNRERMFLTDGLDQYDGRSYDILKCTDKEMKLVYAVTGLGPAGPEVRKIQYNLEAIDADEYQNDSEGAAASE